MQQVGEMSAGALGVAFGEATLGTFAVKGEGV